MGEDIKKEKVTPIGSPALVNPINKGMEEHEQKGVTVPNSADTKLAPTPLYFPKIFYFFLVESNFGYKKQTKLGYIIKH